MPLEIKELHIKATIAEPVSSSSTGQSTGTSSSTINEEAILQRCLEEVFKLIKEREER